MRERQLRSGFVMGDFLGSLDLGFEGSRRLSRLSGLFWGVTGRIGRI